MCGFAEGEMNGVSRSSTNSEPKRSVASFGPSHRYGTSSIRQGFYPCVAIVAYFCRFVKPMGKKIPPPSFPAQIREFFSNSLDKGREKCYNGANNKGVVGADWASRSSSARGNSAGLRVKRRDFYGRAILGPSRPKICALPAHFAPDFGHKSLAACFYPPGEPVGRPRQTRSRTPAGRSRPANAIPGGRLPKKKGCPLCGIISCF